MGYIYNIVWDFAKVRTFWIISRQITAFFLQATQLTRTFLKKLSPNIEFFALRDYYYKVIGERKKSRNTKHVCLVLWK